MFPVLRALAAPCLLTVALIACGEAAPPDGSNPDSVTGFESVTVPPVPVLPLPEQATPIPSDTPEPTPTAEPVVPEPEEATPSPEPAATISPVPTTPGILEPAQIPIEELWPTEFHHTEVPLDPTDELLEHVVYIAEDCYPDPPEHAWGLLVYFRDKLDEMNVISEEAFYYGDTVYDPTNPVSVARFLSVLVYTALISSGDDYPDPSHCRNTVDQYLELRSQGLSLGDAWTRMTETWPNYVTPTPKPRWTPPPEPTPDPRTPRQWVDEWVICTSGQWEPGARMFQQDPMPTLDSLITDGQPGQALWDYLVENANPIYGRGSSHPFTGNLFSQCAMEIDWDYVGHIMDYYEDVVCRRESWRDTLSGYAWLKNRILDRALTSLHGGTQGETERCALLLDSGE